MKLIDPATGQAVWDSNDPYAGPVPPAPEGRQWVRVDEPGDTNAPRRTAPGILDIGSGVQERLGFLNQTFNPVEGIGGAMRAGSRMMAPDQSYWDRIASLGEMASGVAGIAAPIAAARAIGVPAASAMMEGLLGFSPTTQAAGDTMRAAGRDIVDRLNQPGPVPVMYSNPITGLLDNPKSGITAYHGSPHSFDKFSMDKIGTGEGAQAYGPGLYFAENENVAKGYRDALSKVVLVDGKNLDDLAADARKVAGLNEYGSYNLTKLKPNSASNESIIAAYIGDYVDPQKAISHMFEDDLPEAAELAFKMMKEGRLKERGSMYEVNINANPEDFLDWEKPMSEQPQVVRDFAKTRWQQIYGRDPDPSIEGEYIAKMASPQYGIDNPDWLLRGGPADDQRERLRAAGIPGIRYLDEGSRSQALAPYYSVVRESDGVVVQQKIDRGSKPEVPEGFRVEGPIDPRTRNYVVFDENLINIVRKYGIAGAAAMLGVSAVDVEEAIAQGAPPSQWDQLVVGPQ